MRKLLLTILSICTLACCGLLISCDMLGGGGDGGSNSTHVHVYTETVVNPTCTHGGYTTFTCECGYSFQGNFLEALAHTSLDVSAVSPTCTSTGLTAGEICSVCGVTIVSQQVVDATGHEFTSTVTSPTCNKQGYTTYVCECGYSYIDNYQAISLNAHDFGTDGVCLNCRYNPSIQNDGNQNSALTVEQVVGIAKKSIVAIQLTVGNSVSYGAGVCIDLGETDQNILYIITCHHVIDTEGGEVVVVLPDQNLLYENDDYTFSGVIGGDKQNSPYAVSLVGGDKVSDLALLKINLEKPANSGARLSKSNIGRAKFPSDSYQAKEGESVIAIGNPTGALPGWVAEGVISLLETTTTVGDIGDMKLMGITNTINHGNSGGGLFNMYGELIGITNAGSDDYQAINFAIPLYTSDRGVSGAIDNGVINIIDELLTSETDTNYGYVEGRKAKFGFTITNTSGTCKITSVTTNGLGHQAGLRVNDIITAYSINGGQSLTEFTFEQLNSDFDGLNIGDSITLTLSRTTTNFVGSTTSTITCTLTVQGYHFCDTGE